MLFGLFVSKKKYDELSQVALKGQDDLVKAQEELFATKTALDRQTAINDELRQFSQSFKEFYEHVTKIPVITKSTGPAMTLRGSVLVSHRELSYGDVVEHMKSELIYDIARRLEAEGCVKFDLGQDPVTGQTAYTATVSVFKGGF